MSNKDAKNFFLPNITKNNSDIFLGLLILIPMMVVMAMIHVPIFLTLVFIFITGIVYNFLTIKKKVDQTPSIGRFKKYLKEQKNQDVKRIRDKFGIKEDKEIFIFPQFYFDYIKNSYYRKYVSKEGNLSSNYKIEYVFLNKTQLFVVKSFFSLTSQESTIIMEECYLKDIKALKSFTYDDPSQKNFTMSQTNILKIIIQGGGTIEIFVPNKPSYLEKKQQLKESIRQKIEETK